MTRSLSQLARDAHRASDAGALTFRVTLDEIRVIATAPAGQWDAELLRAFPGLDRRPAAPVEIIPSAPRPARRRRVTP